MKKITPQPTYELRVNLFDLLAEYVLAYKQSVKLKEAGFEKATAGQKGISVMQAVALCRMAGFSTTRTTLYNVGSPMTSGIYRKTILALWVGLGISPADLFELRAVK